MLVIVKKIKMAIIRNTKERRVVGNTKKSGVIKFLIYREKGDSMYTAVCLTFDIVEHGNNIDELKESIQEAAKLHLESIVKNNLNDKLLNRSAPQQYWKILYEAMTAGEKNIEEQQENRQEVPAVSDIWNRSSKELVEA